MADDAGGRPFPDFPDGDEPDSAHHGADEEFAAVVLDEEFVKAAHFHEPSAVERMVGAAEARAQAEAVLDEAVHDTGYDPGRDEWDGEGHEAPYDADDADPYGPYGGALRPYRGHAHWQRPVALLLALVLGVGIVALAFAAVYRSGSAGREDGPPPGGTAPTATTDAREPSGAVR